MKRFLNQDPANVILILATVLCGIVPITSLVVGANLAVSSAIAFAFLVTGLLLSWSQMQARDIGAATALMGQAIAFTAAFQGHSWQIDTHMLFFALLACLIVLRSIPAILVATAITAVHHLSLSVFMPALVFPGSILIENLGRTTLHALIVLMETAVLVATVLILRRLDSEAKQRNADLEQTVAAANSAKEEAETARKAAEATRAEAETAQARAEALLQEAKDAERLRLDAENNQKTLQQEAEQAAQKTSLEQAQLVDSIRKAMQSLKTGDLTTRIGQDLPGAFGDIGLAFNDAITAIDRTVGEVTAQSEAMQTQIQEIAAATANLATRTERQAQMLRESSEGLEELTRVVARTEETVREADTSARTAESSAKSSEAVVSATSQAMRSIHSEAEEISQIVKVIDEIAFQTNLLALNAGVEAARAGDAGRGFAVVASEVRGLAQRSSESAANIRSLIERSGQQVDEGSAKIEETVQALSGVLSAVFDITAKTGRIAEGAQEQTAGISDLNQRVAQLDTTTQQNAAIFEETAAACNGLASTASVLQELTHKFHVSKPAAAAPKAA
ncbi:MAG: methyl-accepting chemotaxis protein [Pseudomonadota bacterium]